MTLDRDSGLNGEKLHLTVTRTKASAANHGTSVIFYSSLGPANPSARLALSMMYVAD